MKKFFALILLFVWSCKGIHAQLNIPADIKTAVFDYARILPKVNNKVLLMKELTNQTPGRPIRFAEPFSTNFSTLNSGVWEKVNNNMEVWRLMIESEKALSLNFGLESFNLPEGSELYIFNQDQTYVLGPFTDKDNDAHGEFWTPIIKDDIVFFELRIPTDKKQELKLEITKVNHDYMGFGRSFSGSCNLDVICGMEDGYEMVDEYRDIISSVGAYHINGIETCSGALINNANEDRRPFYLTAFHCGVNSSNAASVVCYWNYENSYCRQPNSTESGQTGDGNLNQFNSGAYYRSGNNTTDFCLIEFDDPVKPEYKPYFAGWNNNFMISDFVIGIHHPGVEEKRISFEMDEVQNTGGNYITVNDWDIGTTEGGSSGSPLFNENKQIIGQLQGGLAACSNDLSDDYGSISSSWLGLGTPETSLQFWLDPDNVGLTEISGFNGSFGLTFSDNNFQLCGEETDELVVDFNVEQSFTDFVNLEVQNLPAGMVVSSLPENITPGNSASITLENISTVLSGNYTIKIVSSDGENQGENNINISISQSAPEKITTISPENGIEASATQQFIWDELDSAISYEIEISYDEGFINLFTSVNNISNHEYVVFNLDNLTEFYWRVRAINNCGEGEWSESNSFMTSQVYCIVVNSEDVPVEISEQGTNEVQSFLFFDYPLVIDNISIPNITIEHSYIEDLIISLSNPENDHLVQILSLECGNEDDIIAGFSDQGLAQINCPLTDGMVYQPETPFRDIAQINAQGQWSLNVADTYNFDGGEIQAWSVEVCFTRSEESTLVPLDLQGKEICRNNFGRLRYYYNLEEIEETELSLETISGDEIPFSLVATNLPLSGDGQLEIEVENTDLLSDGINELFLKMGSGLEAKMVIKLISEPEITEITSIQNGEIISQLGEISWNGQYADNYIISISENSELTDIVWTTTVTGNANIIDGPDLNEGEYYLLIEAMNQCGTNSSVLYNFIINESVSIEESNTPTLFIAQNVSDKLIILNGNKDRKDLEINLLSISGQKLLSQNTNEETLHIESAALIPGVYFLQIKSGIDNTIKKIIIY